MLFKDKRAQSILEYAMVLAVLVAVIVAIQIYVKRSIQGRLKQSADQIGEQFTTAETYTIETINQSARKEETLTGTAATGTAWTRSEILSTVPEGITPTVTYPGYEVTSTDYVTASQGGGQVGTHGTFDSGKISDKKLFEDD